MNRIGALLTELQALDDAASRSSWLAQRDPRATLLATLAFIVTVVSFDRTSVAALLPLTLFPLLLARLGDVALSRIFGKLLLALPFVLMMGAFNPVFDSAPHLTLLGQPVSGGWLSLASLLIRATLTISAALILIAVLGMPRLCAALDRLGVPRVLTTQLLFMHRYLFLLAGEFARRDLARTLRAGTGQAMPLAVYGTLLGHLLLRTLERALRIHQAMQARGFDGHWPLHDALRWQGRDTAFLVICLAAFFLVRTA